MVAGGRYDTVCDLPVPLMLPVAGQVAARAEERRLETLRAGAERAVAAEAKKARWDAERAKTRAEEARLKKLREEAEAAVAAEEVEAREAKVAAKLAALSSSAAPSTPTTAP